MKKTRLQACLQLRRAAAAQLLREFTAPEWPSRGPGRRGRGSWFGRAAGRQQRLRLHVRGCRPAPPGALRQHCPMCKGG